MKNYAWGTESFNAEPIYVVLFVSRKKDNTNIPNFKERRKSFITHLDKNKLKRDFQSFVDQGVPGEFCRLYISVNARDGVKIHKELLHFLIDNPDFNLCSLESKIAGIAAQKECAKEKRWMFDFDLANHIKMHEFYNDIMSIDNTIQIEVCCTPHGFALITNKGFDTRALMEKWGEFVTLKRDDLLCLSWTTTGEKDE